LRRPVLGLIEGIEEWWRGEKGNVVKEEEE
jgi:hypothetical protein